MAEPVFLHSAFRTGSSWLRSKFRSCKEALVFGEIFHESLATMDRQAVANLSTESWITNSRHPATAPYFIEYAPLISPEGGIKLFSEEMAFKRYFPRTDTLPDDERNYVQMLLDRVNERGKEPVLSCTRSIGRMKQIRNAFGGVHILLTRDPFHQWCSYTEQATGGNPYFLSTNEWILESAGEAGWLSLGNIGGEAKDALNRDAFYKHVLLHLNLYNEAAGNADLIVSYDRLDSQEYRQEITDEVRSRTGFELDLSDFRSASQFSLVQLPSIDVVDQMLRPFIPVGKGSMHPHVHMLYDSMTESIQDYEEQARELIGFTRGKLTELQAASQELIDRRSALDDANAQIESARAELESKNSELNELQSRLSVITGEIENLRGEADSWRSQLAAAQDERTQLQEACSQGALVQERLEATSARLADAQQETERLERKLADAEKSISSARDGELAALQRLADAERQHRSSVEALLREWKESESDLRSRSATEQASAKAELARLEERSAQLDEALRQAQQDLDRSRSDANAALHRARAEVEAVRSALTEQIAAKEAALSTADHLIRSVAAERPGRWQRIGEAVGLARHSRAMQDLERWGSQRMRQEASTATQEKSSQMAVLPMFAPPATERGNPYLRADTLGELLSWHDVDFVRCAYVTILGRQPDPEGEAHYTNRIRSGHSKMDVLWQLRTSREGPRHDPGIAGLDHALRRSRRARMPVVGLLFRAITSEEGDSGADRRRRAMANDLGVLRSGHENGLLKLQDVASAVERLEGRLQALEERGLIALEPDGGSPPNAGAIQAHGRGLVDPVDLSQARTPEDAIRILKEAINDSHERKVFREGSFK